MGKFSKKVIAHMLSVLMILSALGVGITAFGVATQEAYADGGAAKIGTAEYDTLQEAMDAAADGDTITLLRDVTEAVTFNKENTSVTLDLNDKILTAEPDKIILTISNGMLTLVDNAQSKTTRNYKLNSDGVAELADDGDKSFSGGCVYGARDTDSPGVARGILIERGALIMESGTVIGNYSGSEGGGIKLGSSSEATDTAFTMNGGSILGNRAEFGGGVSCAGTRNRSKTTINGGTISYNWGEQHSGAIFAGREVIITGGTITYNHTEGSSGAMGGAVLVMYNYPAEWLKIEGNPVIQNNTRTNEGITEESNVTLEGYTGYGQGRFTLGNLSDDAKIGISILINEEKSLGVFTVGSELANSENAFNKGLFTSDHGFYVKVHESSDNLNDQMELADPGFTVTGPEDLTLNVGETGELSVTATPKEGSEGTMAYQWYKVTDTGNESIEGATSKDLTVGEGLDAGTYQYVCKVTFTPTGGTPISLDSRIATVTVNPGPDEYDITVDPVTGGTVAVKDPSGKTAEKAVPGTEITVTATPENGYVLDKIIIEYDGADSPKDITDAGKFSMPASAVNVKVTFKKQDTPVVTRYTITYDLNGGTLDGKTGTVTEKFDAGTIITLPEPTKDGYTFDYWEGSKYNAGDEYTVNEDHTFTAVWKAAEPAKPDNVPNTGDNGNTGLWTVLFGGSLLATIMLIIAERKYLKNKR